MYKEKDRPLWLKLILSSIGIIVFFVIWELVVVTGLVSSDKLVAPTTLLATFIDKDVYKRQVLHRI